MFQYLIAILFLCLTNPDGSLRQQQQHQQHHHQQQQQQ